MSPLTFSPAGRYQAFDLKGFEITKEGCPLHDHDLPEIADLYVWVIVDDAQQGEL